MVKITEFRSFAKLKWRKCLCLFFNENMKNNVYCINFGSLGGGVLNLPKPSSRWIASSSLAVEIGPSAGRTRDVMSQSVEEDFVTFDLVTGFKACLVGCSSTKMENGLFSCPPNIFAGLAKAFSSWQPFSTPVWKLNKMLIKQSVRLEKVTVAVALPTCGI